MKKPLVLLMAVLALAGCASTGGEEEDNSAMVIVLEENPSTGYSWIWGQMGNGHLEAVSEEYTPYPVQEGVVGSGGTKTFVFRGTEPGHVTLTLSYVRPWEGAGAAIESRIYSVTIYDDMTISYL